MTFWMFKLPTGELISGPVQGSGGVIDYGNGGGLRRLQTQIRRAREGHPLGIYEPAPGCCSMHTTDGGRRNVDLRTAQLMGCAERGEVPISSPSK